MRRSDSPSALSGADAESRAHAGTLAAAVIALERSAAELVEDWRQAALVLQLEAQANACAKGEHERP